MSVCITTSGFQMLYVPPPGPPLNLAASASNSSQINLSWTAAAPQPGTSISKYTVYRQDSGVNYPPIGSVNGSTLAFTDTGLSQLTQYTYYVIATDSKGAVSASSNLATATTLAALPGAPTNLTVTGTTSTTVSLSWTASQGAVTYNLYRNGVRVQTGIVSTSIIDSGLTAATNYNYTVTAVNSSGEGAASNAVQATTSSTSIRKKWVPGHGGLFFYGSAGAANYATIRKPQYDSDKTVLNSNFSGYLYMGRWIEWEPSFNNYSIATIQNDIQYLATLGKNFGFKVSTYGGGGNPAGIIPAYLYDTSNPNYNAAQYGPGYYGAQAQTSSTAANANMWRAAYYWPGIVTRMVALHTWLAQQAQITVNGVSYTGLDNVPNLLWVCVDEETQPSGLNFSLSANGWGTNTYDGTNWVNGYLSLIQQIGAVWKKTNVLIPYNWVFVDGPAANTVTAVNNFMQQIVNSHCVVSPPDTLPTGTGTIGTTTKPYTYGVASYLGEWGGTNFVGQAPCIPLIEQPDLPGGVFYAGPAPSGSPALQGFNFCNNFNSGTLLCPNQFWQIEAAGPLGANWANDIRPAINSTPIPNTAYPPLYP